MYCDMSDETEIKLRSPIYWLHCVKTPMYVFEGAADGNWDALQLMSDRNTNPNIKFYKVPRHDHLASLPRSPKNWPHRL